MPSPFIHFSEEERRRLRKQMTEIYDRFVDRVAAGRRLAREDVLAVARGRVWTGRQAERHHLVDALGDFQAAVAAAKELMGVPSSQNIAVLHIRPPRNLPVPSALSTLGDMWSDLTALLEERALALMPWDLRLR